MKKFTNKKKSLKNQKKKIFKAKKIQKINKSSPRTLLIL